MPQIKEIASGAVYTVDSEPVWADGVWECGSLRLIDPGQSMYATVVVGAPVPADDWAAKIADRRYTAEVRGFIWNNVFIDTDRVSQPKIASARAAAKDGVRSDTAVWKCGNPLTGLPIYRVTSNAEMVEIGDAAFNYVQACYDREGVLIAAVAGGTITATMIDEGWPG